MLRALILSILLGGCSPWKVDGSLWNESNTICPDSEYDNGGNVELMLGYCKSGLGGFIALERNF
jgi:hypothetical protein